jgi:galactosylceramidase
MIAYRNERSSDATYAKTLRAILDENGCKNTKIVAKDGGADICEAMKVHRTRG